MGILDSRSSVAIGEALGMPAKGQVGLVGGAFEVEGRLEAGSDGLAPVVKRVPHVRHLQISPHFLLVDASKSWSNASNAWRRQNRSCLLLQTLALRGLIFEPAVDGHEFLLLAEINPIPSFEALSREAGRVYSLERCSRSRKLRWRVSILSRAMRSLDSNWPFSRSTS